MTIYGTDPNADPYILALQGITAPTSADAIGTKGVSSGVMNSGLSAPASKATPSAPTSTPNYAQFMQQFNARSSPVTYTGGAVPSGMNAQDAAGLQALYATPAKMARGGFSPPQRFAVGGLPMPPLNNSWIERREATSSTHNGGLFNSPVPGRTDQINTSVPGGSYVIPADVVSGLGEGNTMAGSAVLDKMFHSMPYGIQGSKAKGGMGIPKAPGAFKLATGGITKSHVPVVVAGGEYLVHPDAVRRLGNGNMKKGQQILDKFVLHIRKKTVHETKNLKGPKK